jgi:hypothetical protein
MDWLRWKDDVSADEMFGALEKLRTSIGVSAVFVRNQVGCDRSPTRQLLPRLFVPSLTLLLPKAKHFKLTIQSTIKTSRCLLLD